MADYGIEHYVDEDTFYIRQPHCSTSVRVRKAIYERLIRKTLWDVEISSDGDNWQNVYTLPDKESAIRACTRLVDSIDAGGGQE